jgi:nitrite reductase/ring-hydroxylating ferredoxin subunit
MPASQINTTLFNPNLLNLVRIATYDRQVAAPLTRAWENVLDWAHLPHLHETSFNYVELDEAGDWGWRTWSNDEHTGYVELTVADSERYVVRSYAGDQQVSEIWTTLTAEDERTCVHVEFYLPDISGNQIEHAGSAILSLYTRLWDEDEAMMRQRHARLIEYRDDAVEVDLGSELSLLQRLESGARVLFQLEKCEYQLRVLDGELVAHSAICPHLLGPLTDTDLSAGALRCPWHGYEFDLESGECINPKGANCKLAAAPRLSKLNGNVVARN